MTIDDIERLLRRLERSDVTELDISDEFGSLLVRLAPLSAGPGPANPPGAASPAAAASPPATAEAPARVLRAEAIGRLRLRHPEAAAEAPGFPRAVARGDIVAFLEAGPILRPVRAAQDCTIGAPLVPDGSLVGYADPLFPIL